MPAAFREVFQCLCNTRAVLFFLVQSVINVAKGIVQQIQRCGILQTFTVCGDVIQAEQTEASCRCFSALGAV